MKNDEPGPALDNRDLSVPLAVRVPYELGTWVRARASQLGVSISTVARQALYAEKLAVELAESEAGPGAEQ